MILTFFLFASAGFKFLLHLKKDPGSKETTRLTGFFRSFILPIRLFAVLPFDPFSHLLPAGSRI
jgi:hypothetical protein